MNAGEGAVGEQRLGHSRRRPGHEVDHPRGQPRLLEQLHDEVVRQHRGRRRLPHDRVPHDRRGRGEIAADGGEVEWRDRVDEPLEGAVVQVVPASGGGDRLLRIETFGEVDVEAEEIDQLARGIDLRLMGGLRLAEHRRRVDDRPVAGGEEVRRLEKDRCAPLQTPRRPIAPRFARGRDRRLHLARRGLVHPGEDVAIAVRHHGLDRRAGAHLFAADDEGDLDLARGEVLEGPLELDPLGGARRVGEHRLVDRRGDFEDAIHEAQFNSEKSPVVRAVPRRQAVKPAVSRKPQAVDSRTTPAAHDWDPPTGNRLRLAACNFTGGLAPGTVKRYSKG